MSAAHLCEYLEASAARFHDHVAVVEPDGTAITYRHLNEQARRIAGFLIHHGVNAGDRVGVLLPKGITALIALFGIMKARAAYVPVDWTSPADRIRTILSDCQVRAVFADARHSHVTSNVETVIFAGAEAGAATRSSHSGAFDWETALEHEPQEDGIAAPQPDDLAYILYTSGSTGIPKGVMLTHRNATSFVDWCSSEFAPREKERFSSHAPFHFDLSILDIYLPPKHGGTLYLIPDELGKNPKDLARFIASRQLNVWYSTPAILALLAEFGELERHDFSSLRLVLFAGEVFPVKQLRRLVSQWPSPAYYNLYGPTETNVCTSAQIPLPIPADRTEPYPIGWPCSHCDALVLDSDGQPVPDGAEGLLYIAGPSVFQGYWRREQESCAAFLHRDAVRWYNTGDVVRKTESDGFIYVGRRDRMIKRRGYRVELGEVESCLYRHPDIGEAAAIAVMDPESGVRIVAYLVARETSRPSIVDLKVFCNHHLPTYMSPDVFVFVESLPRTSTNKTDYQALIRNYQATHQNLGEASPATK